MTLSSFLQNVDADMVKQGLAAGRVFEGAEYVDENDYPPRIVFIPGAGGTDTPVPTPIVGGNPQSRMAWVESYEIHVWGDDFDTCRALRDGVCLALLHCGAAYAPVKFSPGGFNLRTLHESCGREYIFRASVTVPVFESKLPIAPANVKAAFANRMEFPSGEAVLGCVACVGGVCPPIVPIPADPPT